VQHPQQRRADHDGENAGPGPDQAQRHA
jgi:hypothetical protein